MKFLGKIKNSHDQFTNISYIGIVEDRGFIILCSYSKFEDSYYSFAILNSIHSDSDSDIFDNCNDFVEDVDHSPTIGELDVQFTYDLSRFGDDNEEAIDKILRIIWGFIGSKHLSCFVYNNDFDDVVVDIKHDHIICIWKNGKHMVYVYSQSESDRDSNRVILSLHGFDYIGEM